MVDHGPAIANNKKECEAKWTGPERVAAAQADGNMAKKLFDKGRMPDIIAAIDNNDDVAFAVVCSKAGISDADLIRRMWDATMGSIDPQSAKPCW